MRSPAFWLALLLLYAAHAGAALWTERALWGDGAYYLLEVLQNREFALGDESRLTADVLMELPLMLALNAGVTHLPWLKFAFGLPPYLLAPVSMALCFWMAGPNKAVLGYPLATVAAGMMNTELLVIHESRVAVALFWPVVFGLIDPQRRASTLSASMILSLPLIAAYESAIVLGPLVAFLALERRRREFARAGRFACSAILACAILATLVAIESVVHPTHPSNLALFEQSWRVVLGGAGVGVPLSMFVLGLAIPWLHSNPWRRWAALFITGAACAAGLAISLQDPAHLSVESQYRARILNVVLPALTAGALVLARRAAQRWAPATSVLGLLFVAQVVLQLQLTAQWSGFRQVTREALACVRGLVPVDTALAARLPERHLSAEWMRGWHHPTLSFLDRPGPVASVLDVSNGYTSWQPFNPRHLDELPRLSRYGVDDSEYRSTMERLSLRKGGPAWEAVPLCPDH